MSLINLLMRNDTICSLINSSYLPTHRISHIKNINVYDKMHLYINMRVRVLASHAIDMVAHFHINVGNSM